MKYKRAGKKPPQAERFAKNHHIRHNRVKRFSRMDEPLVDNLFEQCSFYCESVDKQEWETTRNQVKTQPMISRKENLNKTFKTKNKSTSRQSELKKVSSLSSKTFQVKEPNHSLRSVGRMGMKSPFRTKLAIKNGQYLKMSKGVMKSSVNNIMKNKETNAIANFTQSQSVSIISAAQKENSEKLLDVSNNSSTIRLVSESESSASICNSNDYRSSEYKKEISIKQKYGSRKIRKKVDIDQQPFNRSQRIKDMVANPIIDLKLVKKMSDITEYRRGKGTNLETEPLESKRNKFDGVFTPKEDDTFSNRVTTLDICNENSNDSIVVETPMACGKGDKMVSSLIKPLRRENYRNQIMPSKVEVPVEDFQTPSKKMGTAKKCESASCNKNSLALETLRENNLKDRKIAALEDKINQLQMENGDLRQLLNRFMVLKLEE
ncbi:unnamed protein product [Moneuplotes crassus]|uniref:Uncharacterized protein n=1 Tax=Euplotes crassus TaxID=5936 RepID=A0AAD1UCM9_EUPCR|nr:unnamed protein product [Moneuplotes crassus]